MVAHCVGDDQDQVARLGREALLHGGLLGLGEELHHGRLERAVGRDLHPHEALGAHLLGLVGEPVELVAAVVLGLARGVDALDADGTGERLELGAGEGVGEFGELHAEAHVGLVDAEPLHRLVPRDLHDLAGVLTHGLCGGQHGGADRRVHVVLVDEAHLRIELHELVLAVGAEVFVAAGSGRAGSSGRCPPP